MFVLEVSEREKKRVGRSVDVKRVKILIGPPKDLLLLVTLTLSSHSFFFFFFCSLRIFILWGCYIVHL